MSNKATIFLTKDNEHAYFDQDEPFYGPSGDFKGDTIVLEFNAQNVKILSQDEEGLVLAIEPGSDLYEHLKQLK